MANTRYSYDECRTVKQLQQQTDPCRYVMDVPGNGIYPYYIEDPHIRIQKWGANMRTNGIDLESSLLGVNKILGKDCLGKEEYQRYNTDSESISYPHTKSLYTDESRAITPAWEIRDLEQSRFVDLPLDAQENICIPFLNNLNTRILEKDYFTPKRYA
jgi:hypothetical protein|tara:strand:- start:2754 stop:3227 length:474 start_codon:yes stop_codon:yes gene_type:complete